jgi:gamma-butyrobetaine dioxygenase/trimethyllysine dioxygenase
METKQEPVQVFDRWLRVPISEGYADFHLKWLRPQCDQDRHPATGERVVDSSEISDNPLVAEAKVEAADLLVRWAEDGRISRYALHFLEQHAYAKNRIAAETPPSEVAQITLTWSDSIDAAVTEALALVKTRGAALVRRSAAHAQAPQEETEQLIAAFFAQGLRVIPTHFGRIEDLRTDNTTNANTDQLGYTDAAIELHTDQPFLQVPPRLQLLQSITPAVEGGANYLVDARAAAAYLRDTDRHAYELLSSVPVHFHRRQKSFESLVVAPILSGADDDFLVRYSYFTMAPYCRPFAEMEDWYRAYDQLARLVRNPRHQYRFALQAGDFLLYDNHRMLHARTGFRGSRWVRGIYFDQAQQQSSGS